MKFSFLSSEDKKNLKRTKEKRKQIDGEKKRERKASCQRKQT